ncbi:hypothetical protein [Sulfuricurvum sp.]|uniref:hypothetical protein n=1 Tax=Sulfuricurvum sp. TaxID=2025608 RepID=UPI0035613B23
MIVTSSANSAQVYTTNKTKATSAYESTTTPTQTQQTDQNTEIQKKEEPTKATTEVQNETQEPITTQQEIEIKQQASQTASETKDSPLATAIQESSQTQSVEQTKATDKMAQMEEKYKDIYTPMPEKFSQEIEDLQTKLIRERYPDYLTIDEFAKKYLVPIESPTPEAEAKAKALQDAKMAESLKTEGPNHYNGGLPRDEEREAFIASVMKQHPNNTMDKYFDLSNSPQRARALNAAIYEGLENGETLDEAKAKASQVMDTYLDNTEMVQKMFDRSRSFFHEYYDAMEKSTEESKKIMERDGILQLQKDDGSIKYDGTVLDLREYGFDRKISTFTLSKSNNTMIASLQEQIKFFDFILKNQDLVKSKYDELDEKYKQRNSFNDTVITPVKEALPIAQRALDVFSKYEIFDN